VTYHRTLAEGRWSDLTFIEQMANMGSEVERAIRWKQDGNENRFNRAFDRMLELIDLTAADPANRQRLRELMRVRESLVDFLLYDNSYRSTAVMWKKYFLNFACAARRGR